MKRLDALRKISKRNRIIIGIGVIPIISFFIIYLFLNPKSYNTELLGYSLMGVLLLLSVALVFLSLNLLDKTINSKKEFIYGVLYIVILLIEIGAIIFKISSFEFFRVFGSL